jgi:HEPN domain-containing protein
MMAGDDEPERIFRQAIRFHRAQRILMESSPNEERGALLYPICVLAAFTVELLLKCLIRIEGRDPPQIHDLLCLFNQLSASTQEQLAAMWSDYAQHRVEALRQAGVKIEPELTAALAAGRKGFEVIRYAHEEPEEDCVFYLTALPNMLIKVALVIRPDWATSCRSPAQAPASGARISTPRTSPPGRRVAGSSPPMLVRPSVFDRNVPTLHIS